MRPWLQWEMYWRVNYTARNEPAQIASSANMSVWCVFKCIQYLMNDFCFQFVKHNAEKCDFCDNYFLPTRPMMCITKISLHFIRAKTKYHHFCWIDVYTVKQLYRSLAETACCSTKISAASIQNCFATTEDLPDWKLATSTRHPKSNQWTETYYIIMWILNGLTGALYSSCWKIFESIGE